MSEGPNDGGLLAPSTATRPPAGTRHVLAEIGIRLLDDAHGAWQRAEFECEDALRAWREGPPGAAVDRYHAYRAALDREQAAADDLERLWEVARSSHDALVAVSE
jgi:hypothetical protein